MILLQRGVAVLGAVKSLLYIAAHTVAVAVVADQLHFGRRYLAKIGRICMGWSWPGRAKLRHPQICQIYGQLIYLSLVGKSLRILQHSLFCGLTQRQRVNFPIGRSHRFVSSPRGFCVSAKSHSLATTCMKTRQSSSHHQL